MILKVICIWKRKCYYHNICIDIEYSIQSLFYIENIGLLYSHSLLYLSLKVIGNLGISDS